MIINICGDINDNMCCEMVLYNINFIICDLGIVYLWFQVLMMNIIDIKQVLFVSLYC